MHAHSQIEVLPLPRGIAIRGELSATESAIARTEQEFELLREYLQPSAVNFKWHTVAIPNRLTIAILLAAVCSKVCAA